ncbi:helix-turn-helix domain-containing protein [Jiangella sp. DSM 45060]|uniref:helix-turn-helix domain-containing protein n=1 Tax=Jiangella sp. DSM 45060 TaxID=1798224 RepID=UPI0035151897
MQNSTERARPLIPEWTLADRLRKVRLTTGLQQRDFAERLQVTASAYAQWEAGNTKPRDIVTVARRIEMLTGVPATWILGLYTETPRPDGPAGVEGDDSVARPKGFEPLTF